MKSVAVVAILALLAAPAFAGCGWKAPSKMFASDETGTGAHLAYTTKLAEDNNEYMLVSLEKMDRVHFQYRVRRFDASGENVIMHYDDVYLNCNYNQEYDAAWTDSGAFGEKEYTSPCTSSDSKVIDAFYVGNRNGTVFKASDGTLDRRQLNKTLDRNDLNYKDAWIEPVSIFDKDYSLNADDSVSTGVVYVLEAQSRKCRVKSWNFDQTIVRAHQKLTITFNFKLVDEAVFGTADMGASNGQELVFIRAQDQELDVQSKSIDAVQLHNNITLSGTISLSTDSNDRLCDSLAPDTISDLYTNKTGRDTNVTIGEFDKEACRVTATVVAHIDNRRGGNSLADHGLEGGSMTDTNLHQAIDLTEQKTLQEDQVVTFISLAQYSLNGDLAISSSTFERPADFTSGDLISDAGEYICNVTEGASPGCAFSAGADKGYIVFSAGTSENKTLTLDDLSGTSEIAGSSVNMPLDKAVKKTYGDLAGLYAKVNGVSKKHEGDYSNGGNTHSTTIEYTPFFGFENDEAYSPLVYIRTWYGRTTSNFAISLQDTEDGGDGKYDDTDGKSENQQAEMHVDQNAPKPKSQDDATWEPEPSTQTPARRLRATSKLLKAAKLASAKAAKVVRPRMQSTFHFRLNPIH